MKAITVQQPWAWAIVYGGKNIENRTNIGTWRRMVGQRVAIHAGLRWSDRGAMSDLIGSALGTYRTADPRDLRFTRGAIIGTAFIDDVHHEDDACDPLICRPWGESGYTSADGRERLNIVHIGLEHARPVEPIECRGALGLWTLPEDVARELAAVRA